jgi:hypothetical protein
VDDHVGCVCKVPIPRGRYQGVTLADVVDQGGVDWLAWAAGRRYGYWPRWFHEAMRELIEEHDLEPLLALEEGAGEL